jgi:cell wall-associated NlpC family hydrolase
MPAIMRQALLLLALLLPQSCFASVAEQALLAVGTPYVRGGSSPDTGFDCSGLVTHVFRQAWGVDLPRSTRQQRWAGRPVRLAELRAGDLMFYNTRGRPYSHVGIYLGDGRFIHAPKPGASVRVESTATRYWRVRFSGARRIDNTSH